MRTDPFVLPTLGLLCLLAFGAGAPDVSCQVAAAAPRQVAPVAGQAMVTLEVLALRRDLWPTKVALVAPQQFEEGASLAAGTEVWLQGFVDADVRVDTGEFVFQCPAADTDVLARAQALVTSLTPEQLALTWSDVRRQPDLWPLRVVLTAIVELADGTTFPPGREVAVRDLDPEALRVCELDGELLFSVDPKQTDLFFQARERMQLAPAEREPFFIRALAASLAMRTGAAAPPVEPAQRVEPAQPMPPAPDLADAEFVLLVIGRRGCEPCAAFTPDLRQFAERSLAARWRVAIVALSKDRTRADAEAWLAEAQLPGESIAWERRLQAAMLANLTIGQLPEVFVFDRAGALLDRSHAQGDSPTAREVLARFEAQRKQPAADDVR